MGDSRLKAHLHLSTEAEVFYEEGEGKQNKEVGGGGCKVLYKLTSTVHSDKAGGGRVCLILAESSRLHSILAP